MPEMVQELASRHGLEIPQSIVDEACERLQDIGGCSILPSSFAGDMFIVDANNATQFYQINAEPNENTSIAYDQKWATANEDYPALKAYYHGGSAWIEKVVLALSNQDFSEIEPRSFSETSYIPASDRVVSIDHNSPEVVQISDGLEEVSEVFRGLNSADIDQDAKSRLTASLEAAKTLWESSQLKVIQINVGILMVLEEVHSYIKETAKAASVAGLIELIKLYLKQ